MWLQFRLLSSRPIHLMLKNVPKLDATKWTCTELDHVPKMTCTEMDCHISLCNEQDLVPKWFFCTENDMYQKNCTKIGSYRKHVPNWIYPTGVRVSRVNVKVRVRLVIISHRLIAHRIETPICIVWFVGRGKVRGASLRGGKMRGTVRGINARHWVICEAGMCEVQRTISAAGVVVGCEPLKRN